MRAVAVTESAATYLDRPGHWLNWARAMFGEVALDPRERTLRFIEEAVELAQAMEIDAATLAAIVERVYRRPAGSVAREIGQCQATFECLARVLGVDSDQEATAELARVKAIPKEEWARRHSAKIALGIATPSPVGG